MSSRNISIVWDFDGTLTADDSTSKVIEHFKGNGGDKAFWAMIKSIGRTGYTEKDWEHVLASDAPTWMYSLSQIAYASKTPLNTEFFKKLIKQVTLFKNVENFLEKLKSLEKTDDFKKLNISVHHFIVSAGLKEYVELLVPEKLFTWVWGCRYSVIINENDVNGENPESVPVFCMDETMKTRALFEITKGTFSDPKKEVNNKVQSEKLWCHFENLIYIGDGPTDVPALSLVRDRGGMGVVVYNKSKSTADIKRRLGQMSADKRCDLITAADYSLDGELYLALKTKCVQIQQKIAAEKIEI